MYFLDYCFSNLSNMIQLKDRTDQARGTWEDVYRNAKRADRSKNDLHERDEGELERTGQPLCIYEPFLGEGTWPFLHHTSLYRGLGLVSISYLMKHRSTLFPFYCIFSFPTNTYTHSIWSKFLYMHVSLLYIRGLQISCKC